MSTSCHAECESTEAQHRCDTSSTIVLGTSHAAGLRRRGALSHSGQRQIDLAPISGVWAKHAASRSPLAVDGFAMSTSMNVAQFALYDAALLNSLENDLNAPISRSRKATIRAECHKNHKNGPNIIGTFRRPFRTL